MIRRSRYRLVVRSSRRPQTNCAAGRGPLVVVSRQVGNKSAGNHLNGMVSFEKTAGGVGWFFGMSAGGDRGKSARGWVGPGFTVTGQ